jgi:hypothetical protein
LVADRNLARGGIPLEVAIRGINTAFDAHRRSPRRGRKVNSLFYCQQEVEAQFQLYSEAHVGEGKASEDGAARKIRPSRRRWSVSFSTSGCNDLSLLAGTHRNEMLGEVFSRAIDRTRDIIAELQRTRTIDPERLENDLAQIERMMLEGLRANLGAEESARFRDEAEQQLKSYKQRMGAGSL